MTKDQILTEALSLAPQERDEVADALWQSLEGEELSAVQLAEIQCRIAALDSGQVQALPGEQVMQELRQRFRR